MKNIIYGFFLLILSSALIVTCSDDNKSSTEPTLEFDQALIGTWELTKILQPIVTTPEALGIALTAIFNDDGTLQLTTINTDSTTVETGTWSTSNGSITITLEEEDPGISPYSIDGNIATINAFPVEFQGSVILATLEFTKVL